MNPQSVEKLLAMPEGRELVAFINAEAAKLNDLSSLEKTENGNFNLIEVHGRRLAIETLIAILAPFINTQERPTGVDPSEYVVE